MKETLEEKIAWLGYDFRDLTFHSDGRYSCRTFKHGTRKPMEFWGKTPDDALDLLIQYIKKIEPVE